MNERVEEIRRQHAEHVAEYPRPHFCEDYGCQTVGVLLTALAQAEREREFERERADNQHEAAEMFQNQYREALQERDHSRGLVNGLIAERNDARAEVERLRAQHRKEISEIVSQAQDVTEAAEARTRALEAALKSARYRFMLMRVAEVLPGEEATFCRYVQAEAKYGTEGADAALTEPTPPAGGQG